MVTHPLVSSYLALSSLPRRSAAVCFLLHFPWGHPRLPLAVTVLCEARTFLRAVKAAPPPYVPLVFLPHDTIVCTDLQAARFSDILKAHHFPKARWAGCGCIFRCRRRPGRKGCSCAVFCGSAAFPPTCCGRSSSTAAALRPAAGRSWQTNGSFRGRRSPLP